MSSTVTLQSVDDYVAAQGIPTPLGNSTAGYGPTLALALANDVMSDLIAKRFNWKWNRFTAPAFYTNSWQQDYPQVGLPDVGWLEDCDLVDVNSTSLPKPIWSSPDITVNRQFSRTSQSIWRPSGICWMYNSALSYGTWPGAGVTFYPRVGTGPIPQNPIQSMIDVNGNRLILTTPGVTGLVAPAAPANSVEPATVNDGTAVWSVVNPDGMGFRLSALPGATGPVYQVFVYYQARSKTFVKTGDTITPLPDNDAGNFREGYKCYCLGASPNPGDRAKFQDARMQWLNDMESLCKEADKEPNSYGLVPASSVVDTAWAYMRNPNDPSQPY